MPGADWRYKEDVNTNVNELNVKTRIQKSNTLETLARPGWRTSITYITQQKHNTTLHQEIIIFFFIKKENLKRKIYKQKLTNCFLDRSLLVMNFLVRMVTLSDIFPAKHHINFEKSAKEIHFLRKGESKSSKWRTQYLLVLLGLGC